MWPARPGTVAVAGVYDWPDRWVEVTATADSLLTSSEDSQTEEFSLDEPPFLANPADPARAGFVTACNA